MNITNEHKKIAKFAIDVFGGNPLIVRYWDDDRNSSVEILSCKDRPYPGITSYSTIRLSDYSIDYILNNINLRIEMVGACDSSCDFFANILSSCAFNIINTKFSCYPGAIFKNVVEFYIPNNSMKHILFTHPFLWDDRLETLNFEDKKVAWLLAVPISDEELKYADCNGVDALEELFDKKQIDIFDINRKSVL